MPRGSKDGGKTGARGKGGGQWEGGGTGGLSREQREAVGALVTSKEKAKKKKEERRIRRIVREKQGRSSESDSDSDSHTRKKHSKHKKKHGKHSSGDSDSSSDSDGDRKRRQKEKRGKRREKSKAKREEKIAESRLALQQVAELKAIFQEKEEAEKKAKEKAEAEAQPPPEPKCTIEEVKAIIGLSRTRAKERTPEATPHPHNRQPPKPRTLFETIACACEVVMSPEPVSQASVESVATSITTLRKEKLQLAEDKQSLSLGMGSTRECKAECNKIANIVAKHYTNLEDVEALKSVLVNSNIDSQCKQSNTIISKILEGIATRCIEITSAELHI